MDDRPAAEVYEIVLERPGAPKSPLRSSVARLFRLVSGRRVDPSGGSQIISVRDIATGGEIFRHIGEADEEEEQMIEGIGNDLATMTASEFAVRWG